MIDEAILDKLMEFGTREEQRAFLAGVKFASVPSFATPEPPKPITVYDPKPDASPPKKSLGVTLSFQEPAPNGARVSRNRGIGSDMLRMLWTGPVSKREFLEQLSPRYEHVAIMKSIRDLVRKGAAAESKETAGLYTITVNGRTTANYFVHHNGAKAIGRKDERTTA